MNDGDDEDNGLDKTMEMKTPIWTKMTMMKKTLTTDDGTRCPGLTFVSYF